MSRVEKSCASAWLSVHCSLTKLCTSSTTRAFPFFISLLCHSDPLHSLACGPPVQKLNISPTSALVAEPKVPEASGCPLGVKLNVRAWHES